MDTSTIDNQYITYLNHRQAILTVAHYLQKSTGHVLAGLGRRINGHPELVTLSVNRLYAEHRRAVDTVARYGGLRVQVALAGLESRTAAQSPQHPLGNRPLKTADEHY